MTEKRPFDILNGSLNHSVIVGLKGGVEFRGVMQAYDVHMNIVLDKAEQMINGEVKPGTIITYMYNKQLITHRVKSIDGITLITKGDATEDPDPWSVTLSDVKGVYLFKIPYVGFLTNFVHFS